MMPDMNDLPDRALPVNHPDAEELGVAITHLLAATTFPQLAVSQQIAWILHSFQIAIVRSLKTLAIIRSLVHFHAQRLYTDPLMGLAEACTLTEAIYGLNWGDAASLFDMRAYDRYGVQPFRHYVWTRSTTPMGKRRCIDTKKRLKIAYFSHYADTTRGNAIGPMVRDIALSHSRSSDAELIFYCVQWIDPVYIEALTKFGIQTRCIPQQLAFTRLEELRRVILDDAPDVVISDVASPIASWLFIHRIAPLQMYLDPGYPHWNLPELDWVLLAGKSYQRGFELPADRWSSIRVKLSDQAFNASVAANPPRTRTSISTPLRFGAITRLAKITNAWISVAETILSRVPESTLHIIGTGDPTLVNYLIKNPEYSSRIHLINEMVDIRDYQSHIDVFLDTFPFVGGLVCREILGYGVPVISLLSGEWDELLRDQRDPTLLAQSPDEFVKLARQLADEPDFYGKASKASIRLATQQSNPADMIYDIEKGIRSAMNHFRYQ
jgi:predicted O-linked N-acetylglucosamine transferase (SPINDLY family)